MLKRPKPNLYQIWPEARKRRRTKSSNLPWGLAALTFLGVFGGGVATMSWTSHASDPLSQTSAAMIADVKAMAVGSPSASQASVRFGFCHTGGGRNCVVDGDTFWMGGVKIRVADIDAPETHPPRCAYEADLGDKATVRLHDLLNMGPFQLEALPGRDEDRYGRKLRIIVRDGRSLGDQLVGEGLARTWTGRRAPWC